MINNFLKRVTETRYLGVYLDEQLNWQYHLKKLKSKITMASYILIKSRKYLYLTTLKILYYSTVQSILTSYYLLGDSLRKNFQFSATQPIIKMQTNYKTYNI